ncbi:MAG: T9SS type A sorting domain-containing protein [Bacteriodetes bacterium]|nr:T9SS type A sorting domain-containing protein [Bacteroidota bacterium]
MKTLRKTVVTVTIAIGVLLTLGNTLHAQIQTPPPLGTLTNENGLPNLNNTNVYDRTYHLTHPIIGWNWGGEVSNFDNAMHTNTAHTKFYYATNWYGNRPADSMYNNLKYPDSTRFFMYLDYKAINSVFLYDTIRKYYHPMLNCIAQQIEPTITVQESQAFTPRPADKEGGVFGFKTKSKTRILSDTTQPDYPRVLLDKDSVTTPQLVLSKLWRPDILRFLSYGFYCSKGGSKDTMVNFIDAVGLAMLDPQNDVTLQQLQRSRDSINGRVWYLSLNLRSRESVPTNLRDSVILSVQLPIVLLNPHGTIDTIKVWTDSAGTHYDTTWSVSYSTNTIKFSRFSGGDTVHIRGARNDYRGLARNLTVNANGAVTWNITGEMLALGTSTVGDSSITLSAEFICNDIVPNNKIFRPEMESRNEIKKRTDPYIDSLDIQVTYHGHLNIALDWLRFETPLSQKLYRGHFDIYYRNMIMSMEHMLDSINTALPTRDLKVLAIYGMEERNALWWWPNRYQNLLTGGLTNEESSPKFETYTAHALHAKGYSYYWSGANLQFQNDVAVPFYRYGSDATHRAFGQKRGYLGNVELDGNKNKYYDTDNLDSLHSNYETRYDTKFPSRNTRQSLTTIPLPFNPYPERFSWDGSSKDTLIFHVGTQAKIEKDLYYSYYIPRGFMYSGKPWLANIWLSTEYWRLDDTASQGPMAYQDGGERPKTGEEIKLMTRFPLLLGAKGVVYYYMGTTPGNNVYTSTYPNTNFDNHGFTLGFWMANPIHNLQGNALLRSDDIGGDWVNRNDADTIRWHNYMNASYYWLNDMHTDMDHFYLGMKSLRVECERNNSWVKDNGSELLSLTLQAWYGKGFIKLYTQHPSLNTNDSVLKKFIYVAGITTRPLNRVNSQNLPLYENATAGKDSCFYDVTLLKRNTLSTDSVFYLGVQNRRTDALWRDANYANGEMVFVPTADWDALLQNGGTYWRDNNSQTAAWWRDKYWKRQGCREITIPFNYIPPDTIPRVFHIQEVGGTLDTVIKTNAKLVMNYTPGEGKLFRVTIQRVKSTFSSGDVENPNQRKMCSYPVTTVNPLTHRLVYSNQLRYHAVYHRVDTATNRMNVFYKRSIPYPKEATILGGIQWESEIKITQDSITKLDGGRQLMYCGYPSLVVRADTSAPNAPKVSVYVVYACADKPDTMKIRIVENVLDAEGTQSAGVEQEIDSTQAGRFENGTWLNDSTFLSTWGAPTINASWLGNYYSWADSVRGIVTRWKLPQARNFTNGTPAISIRLSTSPNTVCQHPNLNTYSRINLHETEAALVWEERLTPIAPNNYINYSVVHLNTSTNPFTISYKMPDGLTPSTAYQCPVDTAANGDTVIAILTMDTVNNWTGRHMYPMVYRGLEEFGNGAVPLRSYITAHWDRVVWQTIPENGRTFLSTRGIDYAFAYNNIPPSWSCWQYRTVTSLTSNLSQVQISQGGNSRLDAVDNFTNVSDSSCVMNFQSRYANGFDWHPRLWQLNYGYWSFLPINPVLENYSLYPNNLHFVFEGKSPRLSAQHAVQSMNQWNQTRRLYQPKYESDTLVSSAEMFYKAASMEDYKPLYWSGYILPSGRRLLYAQPDIDGKELNIVARGDNEKDGKQNQYDTLKTSWFKVGNSSLLRTYVKGIMNPCFRMELQSKSNRRNRVALPYTSRNSDEKYRNGVRLIRGGNDEYRVIIINGCGENVRYTEEIQIDGITPDDQLGKESESTEVITVDLGKELQHENVLTVKPNPADNEIDIKFTGLLEDIETSNFDYSYAVTDALGRTMEKGLIRSGSNLHINTSTFVSGTYYVRVKGSVNTVSVPFVIIR